MTFTDYDSAGVATGTTGTVAFDLALDDVTSIGQSFIYEQFQKDGRGPGELVSYRFDEQGQILGRFSNGLERALYKLPLATFVNADGLEMRQGNLFAVSVSSGDPVYRQVRDPAVVVEGANQEKHEFAAFVPFAQELSNVNLENEFSRMILTQQAYNMSATVFKSVDEMTQTAAQLKA
jgi:flagellar hook protein FlgE